MQTHTALLNTIESEDLDLAVFDALMESPLREVVADWYGQAKAKIKTERSAKIFVVRVVEYASLDSKKKSERLVLADQIKRTLKG